MSAALIYLTWWQNIDPQIGVCREEDLVSMCVYLKADVVKSVLLFDALWFCAHGAADWNERAPQQLQV